ncbi:hypothetical protein [Nocardioides sp.]|uniref:hypothetical protein n=1 Tax=Nocardioides sp. TaxID=35761 RepID=UPI00321951DF
MTHPAPPSSPAYRRLVTVVTLTAMLALALALALVLLDRPTVASGAGPERSSPPAATFATFKGVWTGHTRSIKIRKGHVARERISIGCCEQVADLTFDVRRARGTKRHATLRAEVTKVRSYDAGSLGSPRPEVGDVVRFSLDRGILSEPASGTFYCNQRRGMAGGCGA